SRRHLVRPAFFDAAVRFNVLSRLHAGGLAKAPALRSMVFLPALPGEIGCHAMPKRHSSALTKAFGHDYLPRHETLHSTDHALPVRCPGDRSFRCGYAGCM